VLQAAAGAVVLSPASSDPDATPYLLRFSLAEGATAIPALNVMMRRLRRRGVRLTLHYAAGAWELRALPLRCVLLCGVALMQQILIRGLVVQAARSLFVTWHSAGAFRLRRRWCSPTQAASLTATARLC